MQSTPSSICVVRHLRIEVEGSAVRIVSSGNLVGLVILGICLIPCCAMALLSGLLFVRSFGDEAPVLWSGLCFLLMSLCLVFAIVCGRGAIYSAPFRFVFERRGQSVHIERRIVALPRMQKVLNCATQLLVAPVAAGKQHGFQLAISGDPKSKPVVLSPPLLCSDSVVMAKQTAVEVGEKISSTLGITMKLLNW